MRAHPKVVYRTETPNQSVRTSTIRAIVVHSTEGSNIHGSSADLIGVAKYLCRPAVQASCHVITDDDGRSARICSDKGKAWHCAAFNSATIGIEQVGRAAQSTWGADELRETARWIALLSKRHGIPIRKGRVSSGAVIVTGVLRHSDLGAAGGGHHDPGGNYPLDHVLALARFYRRKL